MAKQPLNAEVFYADAWHALALANDPSVEELLSVRKPIEIGSGRADEIGHASPVQTEGALRNPDGTWNPRNPMSPLYGAAGRNAPARLSLGVAHPAAAASSLVASTSHVAPSVEAPTSSGILLCAWSGPFGSGSYTAPGDMTESLDTADTPQTMMVARKVNSGAGPTGTKTATASASETYTAASVLVHGPTAITTGALGGDGSTELDISVDGNVGDWWIVFTSFAWDETDAIPVAFPWDTDGGGWICLADTGTVNHADTDAEFGRLKAWGKPVKITDPSHTIRIVSPGMLSMIYYLTRIPAAEIDSVWSPRMHGEISSWSPKRALHAHGSTGSTGTPITEIEIAGPLRRLTQGTPPVRSAARRTGGSVSPAGYWPMEGGTSADVTPCVAGDSPAAVVSSIEGIKFGETEPLAPVLGSAPLPMSGPATANVVGSGTLTPSVGTLSAEIDRVLSDTAWHCGFVARCHAPQTPLGSLIWNPLWVSMLSTADIFTVLYTSFSAGAYGATHGFDVNGSAIAGTVVGGFTTFNPWQDGAWHTYWFEVSQSGGNIACDLYVDGVLRDSRTQAGTLSRPISWRGPTLADGTMDAVADNNIESAVSIGHVTFGDATHGLTRDEWHDSINGYPGEVAGTRFLRLCAEEGIAAATVGDPEDTPEMGAQYPDTLVGLFREIETTDDGLVFDARTFFGHLMRTGRSLYNQEPVLELDYELGHVAAPFDPIIDDLFVRNDVTAERREGSSAQAVKLTGPLNVSEPNEDPEGVGRYVHSVRVNTYSDLVLPDVASWHLHRGTVDEVRWPTVTVDLDASPDIAQRASSVDPGDRITIDNHPDSPDTISLIVIGAVETIESHHRKITFTCIPEKAFHVVEVDHDVYNIIGSETATLNEDLDTTETGIDVALGHDGAWVHEVDYDVVVGGERMTLTAVGAAAGTFPNQTQTFTVTRSVNGVAKTHLTGARVELFNAAFYGQ